MTLATTGENGDPHAAPVYFAHRLQPKLHLYFFSDKDSQHAHDLRSDPRAAAALYPEAGGWQEIRGLQLRGEAAPVPGGDEWEVAWNTYREKFPFVTHLKAVVARNTLYVFTPRWLRWLDNRRGFGFKQEWELP